MKKPRAISHALKSRDFQIDLFVRNVSDFAKLFGCMQFWHFEPICIPLFPALAKFRNSLFIYSKLKHREVLFSFRIRKSTYTICDLSLIFPYFPPSLDNLINPYLLINSYLLLQSFFSLQIHIYSGSCKGRPKYFCQ